MHKYKLSFKYSLIYMYFSCFTGTPVNVTLSIVREQGSSGEVAVHYQTRPALSYPPSNQAAAGMDYAAKEDTIIMINGATVTLVTITILPVRTDCWVTEKFITCTIFTEGRIIKKIQFLTFVNIVRINLSSTKPRK